jgi:hypothetical protein
LESKLVAMQETFGTMMHLVEDRRREVEDNVFLLKRTIEAETRTIQRSFLPFLL